MSATGYTPIYLYYSSTATNQPSAGNLGYGELAINITDGYLFYKDNANAIQKIGIKNPATKSGSLAQFASTTSAELAGVISDETGSGVLVFGTSPTIATPTLTGDATLSTGNLVVGTSGKGIDFSATPGTGTSELLADYEEGTWTPKDDIGGTLTQNNPAIYIKIGRFVTLYFDVTWTSNTNTYITNFPYTVSTTYGTGFAGYNNTSGIITYLPNAGTTYASIYNGNATPANPAGARFVGNITYYTST